VTATGEYGYTSAVATETSKVLPVAVETESFNSRLTAHFVGGTSGNDTVKFGKSGRSGIAVTLNGVSRERSTQAARSSSSAKGGPTPSANPD
jgi:hypothetical protein